MQEELNFKQGGKDIFTVSSFSVLLKSVLEGTFRDVTLIGEVSGLTRHSSGHVYFTLKDETAVIKAVCFREQARLLPGFEDGTKVVVTGRVSAYERGSYYQIIVKELQEAGRGELAKLLEETKAKLAKEGLFDARHKKPIPFLPARIGVVSSRTGAVIHDILTTIESRFPSHIILAPALVQGKEAVPSVIKALRKLEQAGVDVIIIARGGGSFEDLFVFNEEALIRAVFACNVPVISAIGHETDFTLCDLVSDLRAPTPTAAAKMALPELRELKTQLEGFKARLKNALEARIKHTQARLARFSKAGFLSFFKLKGAQLEGLSGRLKLTCRARVQTAEARLALLKAKLELLNPEAPLKRGFALVEAEDGTIITTAAAARTQKKLTLKLHDGSLDVAPI